MSRPTADEIERRVEAWHAAASFESLHEALGWTPREYERWVHDPDAVPDRPLPPWTGDTR